MGLSTAEARLRLGQYGANAVTAQKRNPLWALAAHFWGPIPWLLEATLVLLLTGRRFDDAIAVAFLLCFNAAVAAIQEGKSRNAVELLQKRIVVQARVSRDGAWQILSAQGLVPGDLIHLGAGDIVPADAEVRDGQLDVDQSVLTGESAARTLRTGERAYAASTVARGDATATVTATGRATAFGRTADLVRVAKSTGQLEHLVLRLVATLTTISFFVIAAVALAAWRYGFGASDILAFAVMILLASVPIALPAAFTVATTIGSLELAKRGALVTRLSALEDAASMEVLCVDKTGTITENLISVDACVEFPPYSAGDVASFAAYASDEAGQDPIDLAVLRYARSLKIHMPERTSFSAFDPAKKYSSATVTMSGRRATVYKGTPPVIAAMTGETPRAFAENVDRLASTGARVLAVAVRYGDEVTAAGLIALTDPPRPDARMLVERLRGLGVKLMMLTGDALPTALHVAAQVGIAPDAVHASVYPEDKLKIVKQLQQSHAVVGMTGDGINDAPALRQATVGIAVSSATDVAKSAAGIVLTQPGLGNIVSAVESGRAIFERMTTYTMMKIVKYLEIIGVLTAGFFVTKSFLTTPELLVALLVLNDFVTLSVSTDNVSASRTLDIWRIWDLLAPALFVSLGTALAVAAVTVYSAIAWHANVAQLRSVVFLALVTMGQVALYLVRTRPGTAGAPPSRVLIAASCFAVICAVTMTTLGFLTAPISWVLAGSVVIMLLAAGSILLGVKTLQAALRRFSNRKTSSAPLLV